jgi:hypothetical protein
MVGGGDNKLLPWWTGGTELSFSVARLAPMGAGCEKFMTFPALETMPPTAFNDA